MAIKNLTVNTDRSVTLIDDLGNIISMSSALAGILREQLARMDVQDAIRYAVEDLDGDIIQLGSYDGTTDEFIEEVYSIFANEIDFGNYPDDDAIQNAIIDTASDYGILIPDDE